MMITNIISTVLLLAAFGSTGNLEVTFDNIQEKHIGKTLVVGYWKKNKSDFPKEGTNDFVRKITITSSNQVVSKQMGQGTYSISAFIDVNGNGKLDTNFFGIPKEPYCFSNNYLPKLSAPNFEDCSFEHNGETSLTIKMVH